MRATLWLSTLVLPAILLGCDDPTKGKVAASVASAAVVPEASVTVPDSSAIPVRYAVTHASSQIGFVGSKVTGKHEGSFGKFDGSIDVPGGSVEAAKLALAIDVESLKTDDEELDDHLRSKDFFDVTRFPKASFVSTAIAAGGKEGATHTLTGNLELHGIRRSIAVPATIKIDNGILTANSEFTINRKDFGIVYPGKRDDLIKDEVLIKIAIQARPTN